MNTITRASYPEKRRKCTYSVQCPWIFRPKQSHNPILIPVSLADALLAHLVGEERLHEEPKVHLRGRLILIPVSPYSSFWSEESNFKYLFIKTYLILVKLIIILTSERMKMLCQIQVNNVKVISIAIFNKFTHADPTRII